MLGFLVLAWLSLIVILLVAPETYRQTLEQLPGYGGQYVRIFLALISLLIAFLALGVIRRWRWAFWLILIAFASGLLRPAATGLQLAGIMAAQGPSWYLVFQALIGVGQFIIAALMFIGYRRAGVWGSFA